MLLFLYGLAACSSSGYTPSSDFEKLPDPEDKPSWNARFPTQTYITAWGVSNQSMQMAEQDARAAVAAAVRSSIESELVSVMESESSNGIIRDYQKLESITKTRTHFKHAELIKLVPPTAHHQKGEFWVMAKLSRREAVAELMIPYEAEARPFRFLAARIDSLQNDPPAFTTTWNNIKISQQKMQPFAVEIRAVAGGKTQEIIRDESLFQKAETSRLVLLGNLKIAVILDECPQLNPDELTSQISTALTNLGLTVVGETCQPAALRLQVTPELQWTNVMGQVVQLDLTGKIGQCDQATPWNLFHINDRRMRGEGRLPMEDLYGRLDAEFFEEKFLQILNPYIPF